MVNRTPRGADLGSAQGAVQTRQLQYCDTVIFLISHIESKLLHSENMITAADRLSRSCIVTPQQSGESTGHDVFVLFQIRDVPSYISW